MGLQPGLNFSHAGLYQSSRFFRYLLRKYCAEIFIVYVSKRGVQFSAWKYYFYVLPSHRGYWGEKHKRRFKIRPKSRRPKMVTTLKLKFRCFNLLQNKAFRYLTRPAHEKEKQHLWDLNVSASKSHAIGYYLQKWASRHIDV